MTLLSSFRVCKVRKSEWKSYRKGTRAHSYYSYGYIVLQRESYIRIGLMGGQNCKNRIRHIRAISPPFRLQYGFDFFFLFSTRPREGNWLHCIHSSHAHMPCKHRVSSTELNNVYRSYPDKGMLLSGLTHFASRDLSTLSEVVHNLGWLSLLFLFSLNH